MNRILALLVTLMLLLAACSPAAPTDAPATNAPQPTADQTSATDASIDPTAPSENPTTARSATFAEISGIVEARSSTSAEFAAVSLGESVPVGGEVRTGEDGKARLDLSPEGTIVRVVPNSSFTVTDLSGDAAAPSSKFQLYFGKIFILLKGGELEVKTPSGVASVRGSLLGLSFDPETNTFSATCLEGHCSLENEEGVIEMTDGQAADIIDGDLSDEARSMTAEELADWVEAAPEVDEFIDELPDLPEDEAPPDDGGDTSGEAPPE